MSSRTHQLDPQAACPHDAWYNGNPILMIANGTFADMLPMLEEHVAVGIMDREILDKYIAQWNAIPLEERRSHRNSVIQDTTPVPIKQKDGKIEMIAKPSDNGRMAHKPQQMTKKRQPRVAPGSLINRPDPFAAEEASAAARGALSSAPNPMGNSIPQAIKPNTANTPQPPRAQVPVGPVTATV